MKLACILISHLPVKIERQRDPRLRGRPVVVAHGAGSRRLVLDCSPEAAGVLPDMPLQEAMGRCKDAALVEADPAHYREVFDRLLERLEQRSPEVEEASLGLAHVRLDGLEALYGSEARLITALLHAIPRHLDARMGIGGGKFPAHVAATLASPDRPVKAPEDAGAFLAPLSVDLLPLPWAVRTRLRGFGLRTLGDVAALSMGPLQAQLGRDGKTAWELARGIDPRPLVPRTHEETVIETLSFSTPVVSLETLTTATDVLLGRAFSRPALRGRYAREALLGGRLFRAAGWQRRVSFAEPLGDRQRALYVLRHVLETHPPPGPLEELSLTLARLTGEAGLQSSLFNDVRREENLREAVRQLEVRLGRRPPIYQVREVEPWSRIPERRQALVQYVP
ncbi:MAG: DNA polymerase Y family protein [Chloroflexi bacterium]|nr:DNA polymerase Y family protein [Chloroflexota bacterium]